MAMLCRLEAQGCRWVRTGVQESPVYRAEVAVRGAGTGQASARPGSALLGLFRRNQLRVTLASALLSVGVIGAGLAVWLPTYLEKVRHLTVEGLRRLHGHPGDRRVRWLCQRWLRGG